MNAERLERKLQWYQITGYMAEEGRPVVAFVQATSRKKVLRYHGGKRRQRSTETSRVIWFPTDQKEVQLLGRRLKPERLRTETDAIIQVIPVTRYFCECGKVHVSEYPYPSLWCSCGKKAFAAREGTAAYNVEGNEVRGGIKT